LIQFFTPVATGVCLQNVFDFCEALFFLPRQADWLTSAGLFSAEDLAVVRLHFGIAEVPARVAFKFVFDLAQALARGRIAIAKAGLFRHADQQRGKVRVVD
jgi:hypothetical protein